MMDARELLDAAREARKNAYAPYSGFLVGAALAARDGRVFVGCNVENASFGGTLCAERVSLGAAVASGARDFCAIAIVGGAEGADPTEPCFPCGICRQVLAELCDGEMPVYLEGARGVQTYLLRDLLPHAFALKEDE